MNHRDFPDTGRRYSLVDVGVDEARDRKEGEKGTESHRGRQVFYIIGLVVDETYACLGDVLLNTLLGGLVWDSDLGRSYRSVPANAQAVFQEAQLRGRGDLLAMAKYDPGQRHDARPAVFFEKSVYEDVIGVIALYYTGDLQFVPNPFSARRIDDARQFFPPQLAPFHPGVPSGSEV